MTEQFPVDVREGEIVEIDCLPYVFARFDADGAAILRAPRDAHYGDFKMPTPDGDWRLPVGSDLNDLMAKDRIVFRGLPLDDAPRRLAREKDLDDRQVYAMDPMAEFRTAIERRHDQSDFGTSDDELAAFMADALADPAIAAIVERVADAMQRRETEDRETEERRRTWRWAMANRERIASGLPPLAPEPEPEPLPEIERWNGETPAGTLRGWLAGRGREGQRRAIDGLDMRGRWKRIRKVDHPPEILMYHATRAAIGRVGPKAHHDRYVTELGLISAGLPVDRLLLRNVEDETDWSLSDVKAEYPRPAKPYVGMLYHTFWRLVRDLSGETTYGQRTSRRAAEGRYGGGGRREERTHVGARSWIDDTPVPNVFLVDEGTGIPMGLCSFMLMRENVTTCALGWALVAGGPSTGAVLRVVKHANSAKDVPQDLLDLEPGLRFIRARTDMIGFDNTLAAHGRSVEDVLNGAYIACKYAKSEQPRDKSGTERMLGAFQKLCFEHVPDANFDVERMRRYGFDPDTQVLIGFRTAQTLLNRAAYTLNLSRSRGHDGRQRSLVWKQKVGARKLNKIENIDQFNRSVGRLEDDVAMNNAGIETLNRRFSPGYREMKAIIQRMERGRRVPRGDISPKQARRSANDRRRLSYKVRIKIDEDDIGRIQVWIPHPADKAEWVTFECTDPAAHGMPLWLHHACLDFAKREALDYISPDQQAAVRARLFDDIANTTAASAERERRRLARAMADPNTRSVLGQIVEVRDETVPPAAADAPDEPDDGVGSDLSGGTRRSDAALPRPQRGNPKPPAALRRRNGAGAAIGAETSRDPAAPPARRQPRKGARGGKSSGGRKPPSKQSADRPDAPAPTRTRAKGLTWGDVM